MRRGLKIGLGTVALLAAGVAIYDWVEARQCERRGEAYKARIAELDAAAMRVLVGAPKEAVAQFFRDSKIDFFYAGVDTGNEATGRIDMRACSPGWYCGDSAVIIVTVRFDKDWRVAFKKVDGGFDNCL